MATITFTATHPTTGETVTRSTGSMDYTHVVFGDSTTWHTSEINAHKAASSRQHTWSSGRTGRVVEAVPTKVNGKVKEGDFHNWSAATRALVAAKLGQVVA